MVQTTDQTVCGDPSPVRSGPPNGPTGRFGPTDEPTRTHRATDGAVWSTGWTAVGDSRVTARIHPGSAILSMDHSVITLGDGGRADGTETAFLSFYDIAFSATLGAGHVALLRVPSAGVDAVFTDRLDLGRKMQARLLGMGTKLAMLEREPVIMTDVRRDPGVAGG